MGTEIISGLIIGFFVKDWLGRIILPFAVGIFVCVEFLFFAMRKNPHRKTMREAGVTEDKIEEVEQTLKHPFRAFSIRGLKLYALQFVGSSLTALFFSLIAGAIRAFLIDK